MRLIDFINSLAEEELADYSARCGTTVSYMTVHIRYARKEPRKELRAALSRESRGAVTQMEVLQHFGLVEAA